ncbi:MAG TPA: hypothetical protein DCY51_08340 [Bacteroidetes bacterium]|nr:hypothetical protein [Bacteroidota bacterium]
MRKKFHNWMLRTFRSFLCAYLRRFGDTFSITGLPLNDELFEVFYTAEGKTIVHIGEKKFINVDTIQII